MGADLQQNQNLRRSRPPPSLGAAPHPAGALLPQDPPVSTWWRRFFGPKTEAAGLLLIPDGS
jgi:hypothetical protein